MKIAREKNIITIEIEPSDCDDSMTPEMVADAVASGMKRALPLKDEVARAMDSVPSLHEALVEETKYLKERWEL